MKNICRAILVILIIHISFVLISCGGGGGGGGGDQLSAAEVFLEVNPREIDSGDRLRVKIFLSDIHEDGVLLKVRYPRKLTYVNNTTILSVGEAVGKLNPGIEETPGTASSSKTYLVYDLPHSVFGSADRAEVELILEGEGEINSGRIEVDADFNDPNFTIEEKFNGLRPEFDSKDSIDIHVNDSSGNIVPTTTPTATITPTATNTAATT